MLNKLIIYSLISIITSWEVFFSQTSYYQKLNNNYSRKSIQEKHINYISNLANEIFIDNKTYEQPKNNDKINNRWISIGPYGGDVRSLAISSIDTNIIYAGTSDGGIYKSENSGLTWKFSQFANSWSHHLIIHPNNDSIVYGVVLLENGCGVITKTTNGGMSWRHTQPIFPFFCLTIDKNNPNVCYGGGGAAIYKSTDAGESWYYSGLSGALVYDVAVSPLNPLKVFALIKPFTWGNSALYISNNAGLSWEETQLPPQYDVYVVTPDYSDSLIVYAGTNSLFKSTDGGYTWNQKLGETVYDIEIDPNDPLIVYVSTPNNVMRSTDKGETWAGIGIETKFFSQSIIVNPQNPNTLLTGTLSYGIFKTFNLGNYWFESHTGIDNIRSRDVEFDPTDPMTIYIASDGQGVYKTTDGGISWEIKANGLDYPYNTWGQTVAINPHNKNEVYYGTLWTMTTSNWCIYKSTNNGDLWYPLTHTNGREWVNSIVVDLEDSNSVYATTNSGFMISNNGGDIWNYVYPSSTDPSLYAIIIDPNNPWVFYSSNWQSSSGIYKSTNKGSDWIQKNNGINELRIKTLAIDNSNSSILYTGTGNKIYKSTDSAENWIEVFEYDSLAETMALLVNYVNPSYIYAGTTYCGMFVSYDGGRKWFDFDDGFYNSNPEIYALGSSPAEPHIIYAATWNHGLFKYSDTTLVTVENEKKLVKEFSLSLNYPNPFNPSTKISWQSPISGWQTLKVYDILGNEVATLVDEFRNAGSYEVDFNPASPIGAGSIKNLASSVYFYQLRVGDFIETKKMILLK